MQRIVTAEIDLEVTDLAEIIVSAAVAAHVPRAGETLTFTRGDRTCAPTEIIDAHGTRLHRLDESAGELRVRYEALIEGESGPAPTSEMDRIVFLRPSRYCPSDELLALARDRFAGGTGATLLAAVGRFVERSITYAPGLSVGTDSALTTLKSGEGVCRDYAHVVIALLRAMDVPARYVACYAPGLSPMDFHAVAEAYLDGAWYVIDATRLSDRRSLVRIATGRDAADCAFLTTHGGQVQLRRVRVDARVVPGTRAATDQGATLPGPAAPPHENARAGASASDNHIDLVQLA